MNKIKEKLNQKKTKELEKKVKKMSTKDIELYIQFFTYILNERTKKNEKK